MTDAGNAAIPARVPLHPVIREESRDSEYRDSSLPEPPIELIRNNVNNINNNNNNNNNSKSTNNAAEINLANLHPTNPFLQDLLISQYNANNPGNAIVTDPSSPNGQPLE